VETEHCRDLFSLDRDDAGRDGFEHREHPFLDGCALSGLHSLRSSSIPEAPAIDLQRATRALSRLYFSEFVHKVELLVQVLNFLRRS
jgi:hypothetical protein